MNQAFGMSCWDFCLLGYSYAKLLETGWMVSLSAVHKSGNKIYVLTIGRNVIIEIADAQANAVQDDLWAQRPIAETLLENQQVWRLLKAAVNGKQLFRNSITLEKFVRLLDNFQVPRGIRNAIWLYCVENARINLSQLWSAIKADYTGLLQNYDGLEADL